MKFIISIDTEADNQWDHGRELTAENIKWIPPLQELCDRYGIKPVYLVTSEVCADNYARDILKGYQSDGRAEIGTHLHSWTTPPFSDNEGLRFNDERHAFANELPDALLNEKIRNITAEIESAFGKQPVSFRSGRFGFDNRVAKALIENSYLVDSSVTPYINWAGSKGIDINKGGPDFTDFSSFPFQYSCNNSFMVELPVTILPTSFPLNRSGVLSRYYFKKVDQSNSLKLIRKFLYRNQPLWLRPLEWMNEKLFNELIAEAWRIKLPYLVMMFHSSELMPGCSIYRKDKESVKELYRLLEAFFRHLEGNDIPSITMGEAAGEIRSDKTVNMKQVIV